VPDIYQFLFYCVVNRPYSVVPGAIAGIADQPLQMWTRSDEPGSPTSSGSVATGFVSGLGRGLVGAVTKPIGGAAEFVSQTSMGILHQVGLVDSRQPKRRPVDRLLSDFSSSATKFQE
jgi:vacuolar protein sorting-associated protein 13B